jgi:hypothetical protein
MKADRWRIIESCAKLLLALRERKIQQTDKIGTLSTGTYVLHVVYV